MPRMAKAIHDSECRGDGPSPPGSHDLATCPPDCPFHGWPIHPLGFDAISWLAKARPRSRTAPGVPCTGQFGREDGG